MMIASRESFAAARKRLPYDAEVEWIRSDRSAYIDTGVKWDTSLTFDFTWYQFAAQPFNAFLGARDVASAGAGYQFGGAGTPVGGAYPYHLDLGGSRYNTQLLGTAGYTYNARYDGTRIAVERVETGVSNSVSISPPQKSGNRDILLSACDNAGTIGITAYVGIRSLALGAVRNLVAVRFTNEQGASEGAMYDRVSGRLLRNAGTGAFAVGPDIN